MAVLTDMFPSKVISHFRNISWATHSPDLLAPDSFLWGEVKRKVYEMHHVNTDEVKQQI
jgi:hypothetical protein